MTGLGNWRGALLEALWEWEKCWLVRQTVIELAEARGRGRNGGGEHPRKNRQEVAH